MKPTTPAIRNAGMVPRTVVEEDEAPPDAVGAEDWLPVRDGREFPDVVRADEEPVAPAAAMVVEANPTPLGPILIV